MFQSLLHSLVLDPRFCLGTQTTAFWGCWSRGKESGRPRRLWRSGGSGRNSPRKRRRHSEHTDTLCLQKYTICFNDQYQKTKQNLRLKLRLEHWGGDDARADKMQRMDLPKNKQKKNPSMIMNTFTSAPTAPVASVRFLMLYLISAKADTWIYCGRLSHMSIYGGITMKCPKKMTGNAKLWSDRLVVHWWQMNCFED